MSINDLPVLSALRTKMQWHQERQRVLSENVSNSDTPKFRPRDLVEPKLDKSGAVTGSMGPLAMAVTSASHMKPSGAASGFDQNKSRSPNHPRRKDTRAVFRRLWTLSKRRVAGQILIFRPALIRSCAGVSER